MEIRLDQDRDFISRIYIFDEELVKQDLSRYAGERIIVNGVTLNRDDLFEIGDDFDSVKTMLDNHFLKNTIDIEDSVAAKNVFLGFHQQGFLNATACSVVEVAGANGFLPLPLGAKYSLTEITNVEESARKPALQTRSYHEIDKKTGSKDIAVTETVEMLRKGKVCGTVKTRVLFTESGNVMYLGTDIKLNKEGLKVIPDTRSLLLKVKEKLLQVFSNITGREPPVSAFNFFLGKQKQSQLELDPSLSGRHP